MTEPQKPKPTEEEKFLDLARQRFDMCEEAEVEIRIAALSDLKFRAGDQWPESIKADRDKDFRPCLTINVLPARERQVLNDQRQNRPSIHVNPVDDDADPETAEILQGMVRHIEYDSNADVAYDTAFASAVRMGFGYFRVLTEFESPLSFDQVIKIKRIRNAFNVYMDPECQEPDYSDAKYGFIFTWMSKDDYKKEFPDAEMASLDDWKNVGQSAPGWIKADDSIRIAEYFTIEEKKGFVCKKGGKAYFSEKKPEGISDKNCRATTVPHVKWAKIDGHQVLDETDWPGKWIPIVPVLGDELEVDGERILEGIVRHTKDPIRMQNYFASAEVETVALAPKAPWVAAEGQIEQYKQIWQAANTRNVSVLPYKPVSLNGTPVPPPARQIAEPAIQAITQSRLQFADDIKAITGIYDAQLGARSNETSGKAIEGRRQQGEISNFHYVDNLTRAIRHLGRILVDLIPKIYNTPRVMRIIGEDGEQKTVQINQQFQAGEGENAISKIYDVTVGTYDVTVQAGPSYQTKRQEAADSMIEMTKAYPPLFQIAGDLLAKNLDWPGAKELSERLKKSLPPGLADDEQNPVPPQAQAQIAQKTQEAMQLHAYSQQLEQQVQQLSMEKQAKVIDNQGKMQIAQMQADTEKMKLEVQLAIAQITTQSQETVMRDKLEADLNTKLSVEQHASAHDLALTTVQHNQAQQLADQQHQHAMEQGTQGLVGDLVQGEQGHQQALEQGDAQAANQSALGAQTHDQTLEQQTQAAKLAPKPAPKNK